jgi:hypothetical protein
VIRIQRQRTPGWRMPEGARYVGRGTRWGNRFRADRSIPASDVWEVTQDRAAVLAAYRWWLRRQLVDDPAFLLPLRGATALACWCPLDVRCHADILIEQLTATEGPR